MRRAWYPATSPRIEKNAGGRSAVARSLDVGATFDRAIRECEKEEVTSTPLAFC